MTKINTTAIGDDFELRSLDIIRKVIEEEQLGQIATYLKIFTKKDKGYYSNLRKSNIYFDLTIEVWPPGANRYVLIYIIECKNYSKRIPINDLEEFHNKIRQVSGVNVKGIFISNAPLQEGGYNYAESVGMMVIQGESAENFKIVLHKCSFKIDQIVIPIIQSTIDQTVIDPGVTLIERIIDRKLISILQENLDEDFVGYNIDKLSKVEIEEIATSELDRIDTRILSKALPLSVEKLTKYLKEQENVKVEYFEDNDGLLGKCDLLNNHIGINAIIRNSNRELFILAHETGHFLLHQKLLIGQNRYDKFADPEYNFRTGKYDLTNPKNWIEWQANYFASSLALPKVQFIMRLGWCQEKLGMSRGKVYVDDQSSNVLRFRQLIEKMSYIFNVTKSSIIYKLKELDWITDKSRLKSIAEIIGDSDMDLFI